MYVSILSVLLGGAVRMQDARYVADDVSKLFLWTATLSQQESVEIGERGGGVRREEGQQEQEGTLEGLFLWVTVLLVLSPLVPLIENQTEKKICRFLLLVSPISLSCSTSPSFILVFIEPPPLFLYYWLCYEAVMEISFLVPKYFPSVTIKPAYHDSAHICVIAQV